LNNLLYDRNFKPFGQSWSEWVAKWCKWALSIPKEQNPCLDRTGRNCSVNQNDKNVWYLAGTFGNIALVKRKCRVPVGKAIFFPILVKEDSFVEDVDLLTEDQLIKRATYATDKVSSIEATLDQMKIDHLENYRARSHVFDLVFPEDNIYDVRAGPTRSVCDGFWLFIKPLSKGRHTIHFRGQTMLAEGYVEARMKGGSVYSDIRTHIENYRTFVLNVAYELIITN
jgi:hypothetical protein